MKRFDDVAFITAREAEKLYADKAQGRRFAAAELKAIAAKVGDAVSFQKHGDYALSASEVFDLLTRYVAEKVEDKKVESVEHKSTPLGPTSQVVALTATVTTD